MVPFSLAEERLPPRRSVDVPLSGVLVFSYPVAELRRAHTMLLFVRELGAGEEGQGSESSVGVLRIKAAKTGVRGSYEGEGV